MNNGKYNTENFKKLQAEKQNRLYGPVKIHEKVCKRCQKKFSWEGREFTKAFQKILFCSRACANNRKDWWNDNATQYRTICFKHWEKKCVLCGFEKIVAVHHMDENKKNNSPENLVPLCPNHHEMFHSKWRKEIESLLVDTINKKFSKCN